MVICCAGITLGSGSKPSFGLCIVEDDSSAELRFSLLLPSVLATRLMCLGSENIL